MTNKIDKKLKRKQANFGQNLTGHQKPAPELEGPKPGPAKDFCLEFHNNDLWDHSKKWAY